MSKLTEEVKRLSRKLDNIDQRVEKIEENQPLSRTISISAPPSMTVGLQFRMPKFPPGAPPETKFKVGDKFIPHKPKKEFAGLSWVSPDMNKYDGKILTISEFSERGNLRAFDGDNWSFHPSWCTKVEEPKPKFKKGDWVRSLITGTVGKVEAFYEDGSPFRYLLSTIDSKKFTSHESQLEPYFPREGEYAYMEVECGRQFIIIFDKVSERSNGLTICAKAAYYYTMGIVIPTWAPLSAISKIKNIRPVTVKEKGFLDSKLAEKGLRFDGKEIVKDNAPKVGDFCIFWDNGPCPTHNCDILTKITIEDNKFLYNLWDNCVKFESEEQFRRIKDGKI